MTSPYYQNGFQRRYAWQWWAGQGGVTPQTRAPRSSLGAVTGRYVTQLGAADMLEAGYGDPSYEQYPGLEKKYARCAARVAKPCALRAKASAQLAGLGDTKYVLEPDPRASAFGDWPLVRPQGPEPESLGSFWSGLSDNEKRVVYLAAGGALAYWLWRRRKRRGRRNPTNPWTVRSRSRGVTGSIVFTSKKRAKEYAAYLRESKKPATVSYYRRRRRRKRR